MDLPKYIDAIESNTVFKTQHAVEINTETKCFLAYIYSWVQFNCYCRYSIRAC